MSAPWQSPPEEYAGKNGDPHAPSLWRRFVRWFFMQDDVEELERRIEAIEARQALIEAAIEQETEKPKRGAEWDVLG